MKATFSVLLMALLALAPLATRAADKYEDRLKTATDAVMSKRGESKEAFFAELEKQGRALLKDFPDRTDPYEMLLAVAQSTDDEKKSAAIFKDISGPKAPKEVKEAVAAVQAQKEALGKPLDIKFTSLDGRKVDVSAMKGKVVLVDFWATWCGPCVAEIPNVKASYDKLHPKGFEIVGISFDQQKDALEKFVKEKSMPWPQYFDGKGWQNEFGKKYGIDSIPRMWLVDKKGNLADMNGRDGLEAKVEKMLAE